MKRRVEERVGRTIDLTMQLGDFPSVSGHEGPIARFAGRRLTDIKGIKVYPVGGGNNCLCSWRW